MRLHTVAPKETLWSLGKRYGVPYQDIMRANALRDPNNVAVGTQLRIPTKPYPSASQPPRAPVSIPLYPNRRWTHVVVHHSATPTGNATTLDRIHRQRGFSRGLGYHFILDNGTAGRRDGEIEVGRRWRRQETGAHCNAAGMNEHGIGICLVGDFTTHSISQAQMESLTRLVHKLQQYYGIPMKRVLRHKDVRGKRTACPGNRFPWTDFQRRLTQLAQYGALSAQR